MGELAAQRELRAALPMPFAHSYLRAAMKPNCKPSYVSSYLLSVDAEDDPFVAGRILMLFSQRNWIPAWFSARRRSVDTLRIVIETPPLDEALARFVAEKIRNIPTVLNASLGRSDLRDEVMT